MRACCLWRACEYSMRWIVEGDALDRDDVGCEVEISELEAEQLFAAVSAEATAFLSVAKHIALKIINTPIAV